MCAFIDEVVLPNDRIFMYIHMILCVYVFFVFVHYIVLKHARPKLPNLNTRLVTKRAVARESFNTRYTRSSASHSLNAENTTIHNNVNANTRDLSQDGTLPPW